MGDRQSRGGPRGRARRRESGPAPRPGVRRPRAWGFRGRTGTRGPRTQSPTQGGDEAVTRARARRAGKPLRTREGQEGDRTGALGEARHLREGRKAGAEQGREVAEDATGVGVARPRGGDSMKGYSLQRSYLVPL